MLCERYKWSILIVNNAASARRAGQGESQVASGEPSAQTATNGMTNGPDNTRHVPAVLLLYRVYPDDRTGFEKPVTPNAELLSSRFVSWRPHA